MAALARPWAESPSAVDGASRLWFASLMDHAPYDLSPIEPADAGELFTVQRAAFVTEAQIYGDPHIPPLVQTLKGLEAELASGVGLKATWNHRLVGAVRGRIEGNTCLVGRICVAPDVQGRGIGSALVAAFEASLALQVSRFELHVGSLSLPHLRLFGRFGYHEFRREHTHANMELVFMEKPSPGAASSM